MRRRISPVTDRSAGCAFWLFAAALIAALNGATEARNVFISMGFLMTSLAILCSHSYRAWRECKKAERYYSSLGLDDIHDGLEFEHFIAQKLRNHGVAADVTTGSGDQGVDVIATNRRGTRIAIQTKLYSSKVGNKSVQEVFTGMQFHGCSLAVVVTNNYFTKSAIEIATATGVRLVDRDQLKKLEEGTHWIYKV